MEEGNGAPDPFSPLARKQRNLLRAVSTGRLGERVTIRSNQESWASPRGRQGMMGPPMTCHIRASAEELEHAIIVSNDVMREGEEKVSGRDKKVKQKKKVHSNKNLAGRIISKPMIGCMHPTIASGATPIGSADRAPDRIKGKGK